MKIAFLFLSYRSPDIMARTMSHLAHPDNAFFVHFDRKLASTDGGDPRASAVPDPVDVKWGTFSMIEAEIRLLRLALAANDFDYFVLLSDDAVPLKSGEQIRESIISNRHLMEVRPIGENKDFNDRYRYFYIYGSGDAKTQPRLTPADRDDVVSASYWIGRGKSDVTVYHGSQWWVLNRPMVQFLMHQHAINDHLRMSFYYSRIPDEHYFQTIIGNSEHRSSSSRGHMYTEWPKAGDNWPGPRSWDRSSDLSSILRQDRLFVRKIADIETAELIQSMIEAPQSQA